MTPKGLGNPGERMAEPMGVAQASVSRLERRADPRLSTLSSYVAAMGGKPRVTCSRPHAARAAAAALNWSNASIACTAYMTLGPAPM